MAELPRSTDKIRELYTYLSRPELWTEGRNGTGHGGAGLAQLLCEIASRTTGAECVAYFRFPKHRARAVWLNRTAGRGESSAPQRIPAEGEHIDILTQTAHAAVQLTPGGPFPQWCIAERARSALAVYIQSGRDERGILVANSRIPYFFTGEHIELFETLSASVSIIRRGEKNG
jgi:hypothetical protein